MSKKNIVFSTLLLIVLTASFSFYRYLYQPHRTIAKEKAAFELSAQEIIRAFKADQDQATTKYLNKTITIKGKITAIEQEHPVVEHHIYARFTKTIDLGQGTYIHFKGRCVGYDDLLEEIRFDECIMLK